MRPDKRLIGFLCLGILVLAIGPVARTFAVQAPSSINRASLPQIADCVPLNGWAADWAPRFVDPDYSVAESYQCGGYRLHINLVQYVEQHQGKEAVGEFNSVIPRTWWNATTRSRQTVLPNLEVDEYRVERAPLRLTIWNWYAVGVQPTPSGFTVKAMEALNALRLHSRATTNLTVAVEADPNFDAAAALRSDSSALWKWFNIEMRANG